MTLARVAGLVIAGLAAALAVWPAALGLDASLGPTAAVVLLALGFWATGVLPLHITALLLFALVTLFDIAPAAVLFAGFASSALWLVFGGLVIGAAVEETGLGRRLARLVILHLDGSYRRVIYGSVALSAALAFLIPAAMGRMVILIPIFVALARELGFAAGRRGASGIVLAAAFGTFMPALAILPANLPNMVLQGAAETLYGISFTYGAYLLLHFPVLGLLKSLLLAELICRLFPDRLEPRPRSAAHGATWSPPERRLLGIMLFALVLWATDWLHGISPGWVALLAALLCLLPGIGVVGPRTFETKGNFGSLFYVAGVLGMVRMIADSGLAAALGGVVLAGLPLETGASAVSFAALVAVSSATSLLTALPGVPAVMAPLAAPVAEASGWPLTSVLMVQVIGFSTLLLPYQSPPLMVAIQLANERLSVASRLSVSLGVLTLLVLVPLDYVWWLWLGSFN